MYREDEEVGERKRSVFQQRQRRRGGSGREKQAYDGDRKKEEWSQIHQEDEALATGLGCS
jgi:hypothetical protein